METRDSSDLSATIINRPPLCTVAELCAYTRDAIPEVPRDYIVTRFGYFPRERVRSSDEDPVAWRPDRIQNSAQNWHYYTLTGECVEMGPKRKISPSKRPIHRTASPSLHSNPNACFPYSYACDTRLTVRDKHPSVTSMSAKFYVPYAPKPGFDIERSYYSIFIGDPHRYGAKLQVYIKYFEGYGWGITSESWARGGSITYDSSAVIVPYDDVATCTIKTDGKPTPTSTNWLISCYCPTTKKARDIHYPLDDFTDEVFTIPWNQRFYGAIVDFSLENCAALPDNKITISEIAVNTTAGYLIPVWTDRYSRANACNLKVMQPEKYASLLKIDW